MSVAPSKKLLLQREISDDNAAYNGEVYGAPGLRVSYPIGPWIATRLRTRLIAMIIPWEVDHVVPTMHFRISYLV